MQPGLQGFTHFFCVLPLTWHVVLSKLLNLAKALFPLKSGVNNGHLSPLLWDLGWKVLQKQYILMVPFSFFFISLWPFDIQKKKLCVSPWKPALRLFPLWSKAEGTRNLAGTLPFSPILQTQAVEEVQETLVRKDYLRCLLLLSGGYLKSTEISWTWWSEAVWQGQRRTLAGFPASEIFWCTVPRGTISHGCVSYQCW